MKKRILFVDDEPAVLQAFQRGLRNMRNEWDMEFADSGPAALEILKSGPFDVLVTDMRMPGMDGFELLQEVDKLYPDLVRIVLSGESDRREVLEAKRLMHQYVVKPCDAEMLMILVKARLAVNGLRNAQQNQARPAVPVTMAEAPTLPVAVASAPRRAGSVDVNQALQMAIALSRNEWRESAEVVTALDPQLPAAAVRGDDFAETILDFVVHAAQAVSERSAAEGGRKGTIRISTRNMGAQVEIGIHDSASFVPEPARARRAPESGRDPHAWLAVAHSIIADKLGGSLTIESAAGRGTTYAIRLPA